MKRFALIGYPLGHTMSPPIHKKLFELSGMEGSYEAVAIEPERFEEALPQLMQLDGFNITIPYKQKIIPHCKKLHETAARYGAVNVLDCRTGIGYNTDCVGFLQSLQGIGLEGEVLICGAGGVGRMFAVEAALHGAAVTLAVREGSVSGAQELAGEIGEKVPGAAVRVLTYPQLEKEDTRYRWLINATPVGMFPNCDAMVVSQKVLERVENIFDAIYNPVRTRLMQEGERLGCRVIGGMGMLVWQAAQAHTHWYGAQFKREDMDRLIEEMERMMEENR